MPCIRSAASGAWPAPRTRSKPPPGLSQSPDGGSGCRCAMPHTHQPDPGSPSVIRLCPSCGSNRMRLVLTRPLHHHINIDEYINIDECLYRCDCREEAEFLMMRAA